MENFLDKIKNSLEDGMFSYQQKIDKFKEENLLKKEKEDLNAKMLNEKIQNKVKKTIEKIPLLTKELAENNKFIISIYLGSTEDSVELALENKSFTKMLQQELTNLNIVHNFNNMKETQFTNYDPECSYDYYKHYLTINTKQFLNKNYNDVEPDNK